MAELSKKSNTSSEATQRTRENRSIRDIVADKNLSGGQAAMACFREYAKERPEVVAFWTFGLGFVLGWKLKIW